MILSTPRLVLREYRLSDYAAMREFDGDPEVQRYEGPAPTPEQTRTLLEKLVSSVEENPRIHYRFAITLPPEDIVRGRISLTLNHASIHEFEMGWTVNPHYWGQGIATEAAYAVMRYAFQSLHAHRVVAFCVAENVASYRVMEKLGMQPEGRLRETRLLNGEWHDELVYAILDREFA